MGLFNINFSEDVELVNEFKNQTLNLGHQNPSVDWIIDFPFIDKDNVKEILHTTM